LACGANGANGGSGIVIIRWSTSNHSAASSTTGSPSYNNGAGGYHVYTFNGSGSITL
jgi:hypothetical protein